MSEKHPEDCPCDDCHDACELCSTDRPGTPPQDYVGYNLPERHRERT